MKTFLELDDQTYIEIDLTTPAWAFSEDEQHRHQTWSALAQLFAWTGLSAVLVAILVFSFFTAVDARTFEVCVSSQTVVLGEEPVINPETCE